MDKAKQTNDNAVAQATLDALSAHIAIVDADGAIVAVNRAWRDFAAANDVPSTAVSVGVNYLSVCDAAVGEDADSARAFAKGVREVIGGQISTFEMEYPCHSPDQRRWFIGRVTGLVIGGSRLAVVAHENITSRRLAEESLRERQEELSRHQGVFDAVLRSISDQVYICDPEIRFLHVSQSAADALGRRREEIVGRQWCDLDMPVEIMTRFERQVAEVLAHNRHRRDEVCYPTAAGSRDVEYVISPLELTGNHGRLILNVARDITERRQAEAALRESEERNRLLLEHSGLGVGYYDPDGRLLLFNSKAAEHMGGVPGDFVGKTLAEVFGAELAELVRPRIELALATNRCETYEDRVQLPSGDKWFLSNYAPVRDADHRPLGVQIVSTDVTERKRAEETVRSQQAAIAHLSRVVTAGELTAGLGHELNQPLGAILLYAETCRDLLKAGSRSPSELVAPFDALIEQVERARAIVTHFRRFLRDRPLTRSTVDINRLVADTMRVLSHEVNRAGATLHFEFSPRQPTIQADPVMIEQVVTNLVLNALESLAGLPQPARRLTLGSAVGVDGECVVTVADSGPGVPKDLVDRLFHPFVTSKPRGLGLGLSTSRSIVEQHGGRIWYERVGAGGATFRFTIPGTPETPRPAD